VPPNRRAARIISPNVSHFTSGSPPRSYAQENMRGCHLGSGPRPICKRCSGAVLRTRCSAECNRPDILPDYCTVSCLHGAGLILIGQNGTPIPKCLPPRLFCLCDPANSAKSKSFAASKANARELKKGNWA
jgi:hypothetical protein